MNQRPAWPRRGLYLLTPDEPDTARLLERVTTAVQAGVALLQYRNKQAPASLRREQAAGLQTLCRRHDLPLIINDDWQLAAEIGAAGAHLGEDDGELRLAREAMGPDALLGASCYNDFARAERAAAQGADYLAFGAFYPSGTKPLARRADLSLLAKAQSLGRPVVAIGGISPDNARVLVAAGADLLAVIGAVFDAPDPAAAVRALNASFQTSA